MASKAPNSRLRPLVTHHPEEAASTPAPPARLASPPTKKKRRIDSATLHQRTGRHRRVALPLREAVAASTPCTPPAPPLQARLAELGVALPPARRRLPPATAQPGLPFAV
jgi:hypothetical protein